MYSKSANKQAIHPSIVKVCEVVTVASPSVDRMNQSKYITGLVEVLSSPKPVSESCEIRKRGEKRGERVDVNTAASVSHV